jgi:hypothetical protein
LNKQFHTTDYHGFLYNNQSLKTALSGTDNKLSAPDNQMHLLLPSEDKHHLLPKEYKPYNLPALRKAQPDISF